MLNKKVIMLIILLVSLFVISTVSAADNATSDVISIEETTDDAISVEGAAEVVSAEDNLQTSEENVTLTQTDNDETVSAENDLNVLNEDASTYSELAREIGSGGYITLQHDYYTYDTGNIIEISVDDSVIDGNGAVIDMTGANIRALTVYASNVTIKNLTIENVNFNDNGGAIYFTSSSGTVEYCNFTNNSAQYSGGAIRFDSTGTVTNCNFTDNSAGYGGAIYFTSSSGTVEYCNFVDNYASVNGGAVCFRDTAEVINCNFTNNTADKGGAIFVFEGSVINCNFADNSAGANGGAIYSVVRYTTADTCIFKTNSGDNVNTVIFSPTLNVNNFTTYYGSGEKLTFDLKTNSSIPVTNGNISIRVYFKNNDSWVGDYSCLSGEGWIPDLPVGSYYAVFNTEYAEFKPINRAITVICPDTSFYALNYAINGNDGSVINLNNDFYFNSSDSEFVNGIVINRPVTINGNGHTINALQKARIFQINAENVVLNNITFTNATASGDGGAIYFSSSGTVEYCNFTNNSASWGGAVYFSDEGTVTNCNFTDNSAGYGGAFCFYQGTVINCNFTDNHATYDGGAIRANSGSFENCDFADNSASLGGGGAVYIFSGTFKNCDFADNSASLGGGAVYMYLGTVENCNFTGNNATTGSAIHFEDYWSQDTISNSIFLNNRADAEDLQVTKNENNITITFTGHNNLLNAIYSEGDVDFTNVTYWGANGIASTGSSPAILSRSNKEAGQNISVIIVVNDVLVLNETKVTDENGAIVLDAIAGNLTVTARHDVDSYYTQAEVTETINIPGNETSLELSAFEFTVTAIISPDDIVGNITFTVENESGIVKTLETPLSNGAAELDLSELVAGEYNITVTYGGSINYYPAKANMSYQKGKIDVTIDVSADSVSYGDAVVVNIVASIDGEYNVAVGDKSEVATVENGIASVEFSGLGAGTYDVVASYPGDDTHKAASANTTVRINKATPDIGISAKSIINYGEDLVVKVTSDDDLAYRVNVTVGDQSKLLRLKDGKGTLKFSDLAAGSYTVTALYKGDANYSSISADTAVVVKPIANLSLSVSASGTGVVVVNVAGDVDLAYRVNVTVGNQSKLLRLNEGQGSVKFTGLEGGTYDVVALYKGDADHAAVSVNDSVEVKSVNPNLSVSASASGNGIVVVNVTSDGNLANRVNVTVGNQSKLLRLKDGKGTLKFTGLEDGTYDVVALYKGDTDYRFESVNDSVEVKSVSPNLSVSASVDDNGIVIVNVTCDVDLAYRVNVTVGNQSKLLRLNDCKGTIKFTGLEIGTYDVVASYPGDANYKNASSTTTIEIKE